MLTDENTYLVSGDMNVYELLENLEVDDRDFDSEYNTVGGWATEMLGHIPEAEEAFAYKNLRVTVLEIEDQRILSLRVEKLEPEEKPELEG